MTNYRVSLSVAVGLVVLYLILNASESNSPSQPVADAAWAVTCPEPSIAYNQCSGDVSVRVPISKADLAESQRYESIRITINVPMRDIARCRLEESKPVEASFAN